MQLIDLTHLYEEQRKLDETIAKNHHISCEETKEKRTLALIVEIGELANTTRCFKFWSNKGKEADDVVLDEFADGLHFFLSLGLIFDSRKFQYVLNEMPFDLTTHFIKVYDSILQFHNNASLENFEKAFELFLCLTISLGYDSDDLTKAYLKKLSVNYSRQENNY